MMRVIIFSLCLLLNTIYSYSAIEKHNLTIYFDTDKDELTQLSKCALNKLISNLKTDDYQITVHGHTDDRGANKYNDALSERRANRVYKYLADNEIDEGQMELRSKGENEPIKPNINASNMSINRRVEITLITYTFNNLEDFENALKSGQTQTYTLAPDKPTVITGKQGIRILIEKETFLYEDGTPVTEPVEVELTEALSFADFITYNLATVSGKEQLESGGMFKLTATTASGKKVKIDEFNPITVAVPTVDRASDMQVFTSTTGGNWEATGQEIDNMLTLTMRGRPMLNPRLHALPRYRLDVSTRPKLPKEPRKPRMPSEPNVFNYKPNYIWYQVLSKKKIQEKYNDRYERALENHDTRVERYEKRNARYEIRMAEFDEVLNVHNEKLDNWYDQVNQEKVEFRNSPRYRKVVELNRIKSQRASKIYLAKLGKWNALREKRIEELATKSERLGISTVRFMDNYIFTFSQLSWINVDRFYKLNPSERQQITVIDPDDSPERVFIVFKEMKSMLPLSRSLEGYQQKQFPRGTPAAVMAYKVIDGKPWIYYQDIEGETKYEMCFRPCKFSEIRELFAKIQA